MSNQQMTACKKAKNDVFYTPPSLVRQQVQIVMEKWATLHHNYAPTFLDPCAGADDQKECRRYEKEIVKRDDTGAVTSFDIADKKISTAPGFNGPDWIDESNDFMRYNTDDPDKFDIICTNPPYSFLNKWFDQTIKMQPKIFSYVLNNYAITPARLAKMNDAGYFMEDYTLLSVDKWYGLQVIATWVKYIPGVHGKGEDCIGHIRHRYQKDEQPVWKVWEWGDCECGENIHKGLVKGQMRCKYCDIDGINYEGGLTSDEE